MARLIPNPTRGAGELAIEAALKREEERERALDRAYWAPLRAELELLRRERRTTN